MTILTLFGERQGHSRKFPSFCKDRTAEGEEK
jgi:hypothetical protein